MLYEWENSWNIFEQTGEISAYLSYCKQRTESALTSVLPDTNPSAAEKEQNASPLATTDADWAFSSKQT